MTWTDLQPTTPKLTARLDSLPLPPPPKQTQHAETGGGTTGKRRGSTSCGHVIVVSGKPAGTCGWRD